MCRRGARVKLTLSHASHNQMTDLAMDVEALDRLDLSHDEIILNNAIVEWVDRDGKAGVSLDRAASCLRRYCEATHRTIDAMKEFCLEAIVREKDPEKIYREANAFLAPYERGGVLYMKHKTDKELADITHHQQARRPIKNKIDKQWGRLRKRALYPCDSDEDDGVDRQLEKMLEQPPETCTDLVIWKPITDIVTLPEIVEQPIGRVLRSSRNADAPPPKAASSQSSTKKTTKRRAADDDGDRAYRPPKKSKWEEAVPIQEIKHKIEVIAHDISTELESVNEDLAMDADTKVDGKFVANLLKRLLDSMNDISKGNAYIIAKIAHVESQQNALSQKDVPTPTTPITQRSPDTGSSPTTPEYSPVSLHGHQLIKRRVVVVRSNTHVWGTIASYESPDYLVDFDDQNQKTYTHEEIMPIIQPEDGGGDDSHQVHLTDAFETPLNKLADGVDHLTVGDKPDDNDDDNEVHRTSPRKRNRFEDDDDDHPPMHVSHISIPSLERMDSNGDVIPPPPPPPEDMEDEHMDEDEHAGKPTDVPPKFTIKRNPRPIVSAVTPNGERQQVTIRRKKDRDSVNVPV